MNREDKFYSSQVFAHIDADCFFVSCEVARNVSLKNKNVVVWKDIIVAKSYKAKANWIKTWMPTWEAKKLVKDLIIIKPDLEYYWKISRKMIWILKTFSPEIEIYSIDEAFLNIKWYEKIAWCKTYEEMAFKIKNTIEKQIWITVSVWISVNRLLSKLASESVKPNWVKVIPKENIWEFIKDRDIWSVCWIGRANREILKKYSINTIDRFAQLDLKKVYQMLWKSGSEIYYEMNGFSVFPICTERKKPKSISVTRSFDRCTKNENLIKSHLLNHIEKAVFKLKKEWVLTNKITLMFRFKNFRRSIFPIELSEFTDSYSYIKDVILDLFYKNFVKDVFYRSCWVEFLDLVDSSSFKQNLFSKNESYKKVDNLMKTKGFIDKKFWEKSVLFASELYNENLKKRKMDQRFYLPMVDLRV